MYFFVFFVNVDFYLIELCDNVFKKILMLEYFGVK